VLKRSRRYNFQPESVPVSSAELRRADVVPPTDHSNFDYDLIVRESSLVVDTRNATRAVRDSREKIVRA
jgi:UDP-N-acetyl-D-glucosamine dehydrogenase